MIFSKRLAHALTPSDKRRGHVSSGEGPAASRILATSASRNKGNFPSIDGEYLCKYQKGFVDHLYPKPLVMSTARVAVQQTAILMSSFFTEQLSTEMERSDKVDKGKISQDEADREADEWEKTEWDRRVEILPRKIVVGLLKYHATTLLMRSYEYLASRNFDVFTMDKLTKDPFHAAKNACGKHSDNTEIAKEMFFTSIWANFIAFLADYTLHQLILCYGYYVYVRHRQRRDTGRNKKEGLKGAAAMSLFVNSMQLIVYRSLGLATSSLGGAVGSVIYPGWGTLLFTNAGDSAVGALLDDGQAPTVPALDKEE